MNYGWFYVYSNNDVTILNLILNKRILFCATE